MAGERPPNGGIRISPVDRLGRRISPPVFRVAEEIAPRAIQYAEKLLIDPAVAATLLEEAAATVSRALNSKVRPEAPVQNLEAYLFRAFLRRVTQAQDRDSSVTDAILVQTLGSPNSSDPRALYELKILVDQLANRCDLVTRDMFFRHMQGFSWKDIGGSYGISGHAAESRFSQRLQRLRKRLGLTRIKD